jgi:hypothetical protein
MRAGVAAACEVEHNAPTIAARSVCIRIRRICALAGDG